MHDFKARPAYLYRRTWGFDIPLMYKHIRPKRHFEIILTYLEALHREILPAASVAAGKLIDEIVLIANVKGIRCISTFISTRPFYLRRSAAHLPAACGSSGR